MTANSVIVLGVVLVAYAVLSAWLERHWVSTAMTMLVLGAALGPSGLGVFHGALTADVVQALATATLVLVLFCDAATVRLGRLRTHAGVPLRMLTFGLLGTMVLGALAADWLLPWLGWHFALVVGVILSPTDAALGQAVVTDERVPRDIRQSLNVESGLNDGLAVPFLAIAVSLAVAGSTAESGPVALLVREIGVAAGVGIAVGAASATAVNAGVQRGMAKAQWLAVIPLAVAFAAYAIATVAHGSGFIAAFVGGMTFGPMTREHSGHLLEYTEQTGGMLAAVTFFVFGALALELTSSLLTWRVVALAVLALTVARAVPVVLSLAGTGLSMRSKLVLAWFGPRGLATIVFTIIVIDGSVTGLQRSTLVAATLTTVVMSVFAHGLSAVPISRAYGRWTARHGL